MVEDIVRGLAFVVEAEGVKYWSSSVFTVTLALATNRVEVWRDGEVVASKTMPGNRYNEFILNSVKKSIADNPIKV